MDKLPRFAIVAIALWPDAAADLILAGDDCPVTSPPGAPANLAPRDSDGPAAADQQTSMHTSKG